MPAARDLLKSYREKRDFAVTAEPEGEVQPGSGNLFVVQKHAARRLHYDLRIELDGVLKSWAVTKGPSDDPADKRLAVRVEDHPLEYGDFEGTIPEGEYGGGTVMLWDQGSWSPIGDPREGLKRGDFKFRLDGQRLKGEWVLVRMKGRDSKRRGGEVRENWLLIKHRDDHAREGSPLVERYTSSVSTGRDFDGISKGLKPRKKTSTPARAEWRSGTSACPQTAAPGADKSAAPTNKGRRKTSPALPEYRRPQLATLVDRVPTGADWLFEMKYDGYRCLAAVAGSEVKLYTRNGKDWTQQFGVLVPAFQSLGVGSALIDGEICAFDDKGRTDFSTLKAHLSNGGPLAFFAFDLIEQDGADFSARPQSERIAALAALVGDRPRESPIQLSTHIEGKGEEVLNSLCGAGFEGVIAKKATAPYRGERTKSWLKIKCTLRQEFVIAGWSPSTRRNAFASLLLGTWEGKRLVYRGRVGTGFSEADRDQLLAALERRRRESSPFEKVPRDVSRQARWARPELVAEVAYTEITPDDHLRHPSFIGLREDKPARDVHMDKNVAPDEKAVSTARRSALKGKKPLPRISTEDGVAAAERAGVRLTSPDKVLFPEQGVTKGELVAYCDLVAERMLAHAGERPLSLVRCPAGRSGQCFFQKHDSGGFPADLKRMPIVEGSGETKDYFYMDDRAGLFAGAQMGVLEYHVWGVRRDNLEKPERIIFDIDPDEGLGFAEVKSAAVDIRERLAALGLESFAMVTGGKGIHVIAPLLRRAGWDEVKGFCKGFARMLAAEEPERFTAVMSKAKRRGKLFIDYLRNERGSTAIAPFSTRARQGAPVAVPIAWDELAALSGANGFSLAEAAARAVQPDPWKGYFTLKQAIGKQMLKAVGA